MAKVMPVIYSLPLTICVCGGDGRVGSVYNTNTPDKIWEQVDKCYQSSCDAMTIFHSAWLQYERY